METFSTFMDMVPGVKDAKMGFKNDVNFDGSLCDRGDTVVFAAIRRFMYKHLGEDSKFNTDILGQGSMRGLQKLCSYIHDGTMALIDKSEIAGSGWYPAGGTGSGFYPGAGNGYQLFLIEWPLNFGSIKLIEMGFQLIGATVNPNAASNGSDLLGFMLNATLNPGLQMQKDIEWGMGMWRFGS